jgi:two-component sensor histidine kinase
LRQGLTGVDGLQLGAALGRCIGQVQDLDGGAAAARFHLRWKERGGPPVSTPARTGFGSRIIDEYCRSQVEGEASLLFKPDGLEWTLDALLGAMKK